MSLLVASLAVLLGGTVLVLSELPWFRDRPLVERLRPYFPSVSSDAAPATSSTVRDLGHVLGPIAHDLGNRVSRALGVGADLPTRLQRAGWDPDAEAFRLRQVAHTLIALLVAGAVMIWLRPSPALSVAALLGSPALTLLAHEHALSRAGERRLQRLRAELPVLAEQLGLLISAGYSVTGALTRLSIRSHGIAAAELQRVLLRVRHGVAEHTALAEWAEASGLEAIGRLTAVLALHGETADLGLLVSEEARTIRAEAHRELLETIERRAQLVWIPVTVATLVPGLIFLAVPFTSAMSQVTGGT
jgi:tight adherence protein C